MKSIIISFLVVLSVNASLNAQWVPTSGPGGGMMNCLVRDGNSIFAGNYDSGAFLSTDHGAKWTAINNGLTDLNIRSFAVNGNNVFAATWSHGVFLSTDYGNNWTPVNNGLTFPYTFCLALSLSERGIDSPNVFVGTRGGGVFLSTDNGQNWTEKNNGLTDLEIYSFAVIDSFVFAGTRIGGAFLSTDNGTNWLSVNNGLADIRVFSLAIQPGEGGTGNFNVFAGTRAGVQLSTNKGTNWLPLNVGIGEVNSIAIIDTNFLPASMAAEYIFPQTMETVGVL